jgi:ribulose-5-phosphate 4-epimerase/fuculose-1-phosphate aldolase
MSDNGSRTCVDTEAMLRRELVAAAAQLAGAGMSPGSSGNLSIRHDDRIIISPTGSDLASLDPDQLSVLDFEATLLSGPAPSKEYPFHRAFYRRDETVRAVVHVHSLAASACSCLDPWSERSAIPPLTPYFVMRVGQTPLIPYADPGDPAQADAIQASGSRFRAALLQNHGAITAGRTMGEALEAAVELEHTCSLLLQLGSRPFQLLPSEATDRLAKRYDSPWG